MTARRCTKVPFRSKEHAETALRLHRVMGVNGFGTVRAYQCRREGCRAWHLTSEFAGGGRR